jgi:hypothetical protein
MSADDMLMGDCTLGDRSYVPWMSERSAHVYARQLEAQLARMLEDNLQRDLEHHAALDRIAELEEAAKRRNRRIQELQAENDRLRQRRSA